MSDPGIANMLRESREAKSQMVHTEVEGGRSRGGGTEGLNGDSDNWMSWIAEDLGRDWRPTQKPIKKTKRSKSLSGEIVGEGGWVGSARQA